MHFDFRLYLQMQINKYFEIDRHNYYTGSDHTKTKNQKWKYAQWHLYSTMKINFMTKNSKMRKHKKSRMNTKLSHFLRHFAYNYFWLL